MATSLDDWKLSLESDTFDWDLAWREIVEPLLSKRFKDFISALWVTVNFNDEIELDDVLLLADKIAKKKWVRKYQYIIEQRAPYPQEFRGYHIHMLLDTSKYKSQAQNEIFTTVRKYVGNKRHVHIVKVADRKIYNDKVEYLKGNKWDTEKDLKVKNDRRLRDLNSIPHIITSEQNEDVN